MADRVGVMTGGRILLVEDKAALMAKLGTAQLTLTLRDRLPDLPPALAPWRLALAADGAGLTYCYDAQAEDNGIAALMHQLDGLGLRVKTLQTHQSSLEEIFVSLVHAKP